ncbi:MAG: phosphonopyruvate decarboxylase [Candidatus Nanoarchaeia archaeon]|nr:phosphonopyruvate decarboxylase [Candidatus Nanoarchaeia archaeon]MDD5587601.1 phosphonopyruvate decarboxylase [Candidatus Nanoarchaeia archaeon]
MLNCNNLYNIFEDNGLTFFTGVPDSTFKDWMEFLSDKEGLTNRIVSIEREAIGWAAGYHASTGKIGVVYMQNSGLGNVVNPITSLADPEIYNLPLLLMIGWRGEPNKHDEPQHKKMGRITLPLLDVLEIPYKILPDNLQDAKQIIKEMKQIAEKRSAPVALIVKEGTFEEYKSKNPIKTNYELLREEAIKSIIDNLNGSEVIVSTTGKASRELFEYREELKQGHNKDFLMVGSMGLASSFAAEIALQKPNKKILIFDGDGAAIMSAGNLSTIGYYSPKNLYHIIFDNNSYDSTGGQPTTSSTLNFEKMALACGYKSAKVVETKEDLIKTVKNLTDLEGPYMLIVKTKRGARKNLGRPTIAPVDNKKAFMEFLNKA